MFGAEPVESIVPVNAMEVVDIGGVRVYICSELGRQAAQDALNAYLLEDEVQANNLLAGAIFSGSLMFAFKELKKNLC